MCIIISTGITQSFTIPLWNDSVPYSKGELLEEKHVHTDILRIQSVHEPSLEVFLPSKANANGQMVVICPGGGYGILAYDWEGTDIAKWLNSRGVAAAVLKYRLPMPSHQTRPELVPLADAKRALRLARAKSDDWNVTEDQIGIMGFSAGGHLASSLSTHFDYGYEFSDDPVERISCRPDFQVLVYPVISMTAPFMHRGSVKALCGEDPEEVLLDYFSSEKQIRYDTPPAFLIHADNDLAVPVENTLAYYAGLREKGISAEVHVFPEGGHGFALGLGHGDLNEWTNLLSHWLVGLQQADPDKEEWMDIFNGNDLTGWDIQIAGEERNYNYLETFKVEDGILRIDYARYQAFDEKYGHLYYHRPFSHYKIQFDYRFLGDQVDGGAVWNVRNSGVMIHSESIMEVGREQHFPVSVEIQLLGGLNQGLRTTANICTPGTYFEMSGIEIRDHCYNSSSQTYHGDRWVHVEATVFGDSLIIHEVEGDTVLVYGKPRLDKHFISPGGAYNWETAHVERAEEIVKRSGELLSSGHIALQAESHPIDFKNIRILNLKGCMNRKARNYKSYFTAHEEAACSYD
jgi:acetyl esterase/lipase